MLNDARESCDAFMAQVQLLLSRGARVSSEHTRLAQRAPELRRRSGAGVWRRCADTVAELLQGERRRRARRRWRAALLAVSLLPGWHARAALRVYAPGETGYRDAEASFALATRRGQQHSCSADDPSAQ